MNSIPNSGMAPIGKVDTFRIYVLRVFLMSACSNGQATVVRKILQELSNEPIDFALDPSLDTCLHKAARHNHVEVIRLLRPQMASFP